MKISRGALLAGAYDFEAEAAQAAPAAPAEELPAANPFAFDNAIPAAAPVPSPVVFPPSEVRAPLVAPPPLAPAVTPTAAAPVNADGELPFWIDFGLPVAGAALILFILWVMVLALFLY